MDTIPHEFMGYVRPYYDRPDIQVPVQWYFTPPSAKYIPYITAFANIYPSDPLFVPNVGIERVFNPNSVGNPKGFLGIKPCGGPDAWLNGVSYNNPPPPCDCEREMLNRVDEVPAGTVDGTNTVFVLSQVPYSLMSIDVYVDGVHQQPGVDWSWSGNHIYMAPLSTPRTGDNIEVTYWVQT